MIELPDNVVPNGITPSLMDFGGVMRPALGGKVQRVNRLGSRFRAEVSYPPLPNNDIGKAVVSRLIRAKSEGLRIEFPLAGVDQGPSGAPVIDGAGQAGDTIIVRSANPFYAVREGFWLSIETAGQHYLYNVTGQSVADAMGDIVIGITPELRVQPADGDAVHLSRPMMEGLVDGDAMTWAVSLAHHIGISFVLEEAA